MVCAITIGTIALSFRFQANARTRIELLDSMQGPGDTVQHRMLTMALPDSTLFRYEIGQITFISGGGYHYVAFADSTGNPSTGYLVSMPFILQTASDSVRFSRFAGFDDKNMIKDTTHYTTEAQADSAGDARFNYYVNKQFQSTGGYFTSSSAVRYIVELCATSDGRVIQYLDTLRCYLNSDGHLRYRTPGYSANWVKRVLFGSPDSSVYLKVAIETELPEGTTLSYFGQSPSWSRPMLISDGILPTYQELPDPPLKKAWPYSASHQNQNLSITALYPNPSKGNLVIGIQSDAPGPVILEVIAEDGKIMLQKTLSVGVGYTENKLSIQPLPSGVYQLLIFTDRESHHKALTLSK